MIVPDAVIRNRFQKHIHTPTSSKKAELTLWLMPDSRVYDTTDLSMEGEWYLLSSGVNGRMADDSDLDYTEHLNNFKAVVEAVMG